jgi:carbon monoxide dehydrogenase subunit G
MATKVEKSTVVAVPVSTAYDQWTQFEEFPQFMGGIDQVTQLSDTMTHWVASIGGIKREWDARIVEQTPNQKVAWAATEGSTNAGAVHFAEAGPGQTRVTLELEYEPEGLVEKAADAVGVIGRRAEADLEKFKSFIESRGAATGAWRGDVGGETPGAPGVEAAQASRGDSGAAGVSGKAVAGAAAGVAAVAAAGVAAAKALGSDDDTEKVTPVATETVAADVTTPVVPATPVADDLGAPPAPPLPDVDRDRGV